MHGEVMASVRALCSTLLTLATAAAMTSVAPVSGAGSAVDSLPAEDRRDNDQRPARLILDVVPALRPVLIRTNTELGDGTAGGVVDAACAESDGPLSEGVARAGMLRAGTGQPAGVSLFWVITDEKSSVCLVGSAEGDTVIEVLGWIEPWFSFQAYRTRVVDNRKEQVPVGVRGLPDSRTVELPEVSAEVRHGSWLRDGGRIPASTAADPSGNFRTFCSFSHLAYDDPIVYPDQPGASHLHMFFGNTSTRADSTYERLRSSGHSTCQGGLLNRTAYWVPAVHDASGQVVVPRFFEIYYKGSGNEADIASIATNPNGLRMIAGFDHHLSGEVNHAWYCVHSRTNSLTLPDCDEGTQLRVELRFPMCWNGRDLDSNDHRSHMAYGTGGDGWVTSQRGCPSSHPVHIPELTLFANFVSDGDSANWYLSSDRMPGMNHPNGSTFHADWFGAWDNEIQERWTQHCVREMRTCVMGELGDGTQLNDKLEYTGPSRLDPPSN
jgi:hypothetical protein